MVTAVSELLCEMRRDGDRMWGLIPALREELLGSGKDPKAEM